jgi:hypothetical protein
MSQTRKLLAHALQLNRPAEPVWGDAGEHEAGNGWGTGQNLDKVGSRLVRRDNLHG